MAEIKHIVNGGEFAGRISEWMRSRGGVLVWKSTKGRGPVTTPVKGPSGFDVRQPDDTAPEPLRLTDPDEVGVWDSVEVKRFHVATRLGSQGFLVKVTDGGSRRIRSETCKAEVKYGDGRAWYCFDYGDEKNAVIMADTEVVSVAEWRKRHEKEASCPGNG